MALLSSLSLTLLSANWRSALLKETSGSRRSPPCCSQCEKNTRLRDRLLLLVVYFSQIQTLSSDLKVLSIIGWLQKIEINRCFQLVFYDLSDESVNDLFLKNSLIHKWSRGKRKLLYFVSRYAQQKHYVKTLIILINPSFEDMCFCIFTSTEFAQLKWLLNRCVKLYTCPMYKMKLGIQLTFPLLRVSWSNISFLAFLVGSLISTFVAGVSNCNHHSKGIIYEPLV